MGITPFYKLKLVFFCVLSVFFNFNPLYSLSGDTISTKVDCKLLVISAAKTANQAFEYAQMGYFENEGNLDENIDSAIYFIKETISQLDAALLVAIDSTNRGIELAQSARNLAIDMYSTLKSINANYSKKHFLLKDAMYFASNATVDSYHSSFYLAGKLKNEEPPEIKKEVISEKVITKLDIDQSLFTILKEDLNQKKLTNTQKILKLTKELSTNKEPSKKLKIKAQLKELELEKANLEKKDLDAQQKLITINSLLEQRTKLEATKPLEKDSISAKNYAYLKDEWNKQIKLNAEMPDFLIYQVQLGVFKSDVLTETFKGLTPVFTSVSELGVCYSIGLFEKLSDAQEAKNNIKVMGLNDAFIVAYYKKKKIPLTEAIKLEKK